MAGNFLADQFGKLFQTSQVVTPLQAPGVLNLPFQITSNLTGPTIPSLASQPLSVGFGSLLSSIQSIQPGGLPQPSGLTILSPSSRNVLVSDSTNILESTLPNLADEGYEIITKDSQPALLKWALPMIFKTRNDNFKQDFWQIGFDPARNNGFGELVVLHGGVGEKLRDRDYKQVETKGGKSIQEQALQEARYRYNNMTTGKGYHLPVESASSDVRLQLANDYDLGKNKYCFPMLAQPKSDGFRCRARNNGKSVQMISRSNKTEFSYIEELIYQLTIFIQFLPIICDLDGEMYIHGQGFQTIQSALTTVKSRNPLVDKVVYMIFDLILVDRVLEERISLLYNAYGNYLKAGHVNTRFYLVGSTLVYSDQDIRLVHDYYANLEFEGLMLRHLSKCSSSKSANAQYMLSLYKPERNNNLLKYKEFKDESMIVVGVTDGKGKDKGKAIFQVRDVYGVVHDVRPMGDDAVRRSWFQNPNLVIGRPYKVKYFSRNLESGKLRMPVGLGFEDFK